MRAQAQIRKKKNLISANLGMQRVLNCFNFSSLSFSLLDSLSSFFLFSFFSLLSSYTCHDYHHLTTVASSPSATGPTIGDYLIRDLSAPAIHTHLLPFASSCRLKFGISKLFSAVSLNYGDQSSNSSYHCNELDQRNTSIPFFPSNSPVFEIVLLRNPKL